MKRIRGTHFLSLTLSKGKERKGKKFIEMGKGESSNGEVEAVASKFPLSVWEMAVASTVVLGFVVGLLGVYLTMPASDYSFLKLPRTLEDLQILRYFLLLSFFSLSFFYFLFFISILVKL